MLATSADVLFCLYKGIVIEIEVIAVYCWYVAPEWNLKYENIYFDNFHPFNTNLSVIDIENVGTKKTVFVIPSFIVI